MNMHISMETHAENYLNERRQLGFGLRNPGCIFWLNLNTHSDPI
jgi:hypothetical protein